MKQVETGERPDAQKQRWVSEHRSKITLKLAAREQRTRPHLDLRLPSENDEARRLWRASALTSVRQCDTGLIGSWKPCKRLSCERELFSSRYSLSFGGNRVGRRWLKTIIETAYDLTLKRAFRVCVRESQDHSESFRSKICAILLKQTPIQFVSQAQ